MKTHSFLLIMIITVGLVTSCQEADKAAERARQTATVARETIESPAGQYLPPDWRAIGLGAAAIVEAAALAYQEARRKKDMRITKAIVRGIENANGEADRVKLEIKKTMIADSNYSDGKRAVEKLKT